MMKYFIGLILLISFTGIADSVPYCLVCDETITKNIELNYSLNCTISGFDYGIYSYFNNNYINITGKQLCAIWKQCSQLLLY